MHTGHPTWRRVPLISHTAAQTDPVDWAAAGQEGEAGEDGSAAMQAQVGGLDWLPTDAALGRLPGKGGWVGGDQQAGQVMSEACCPEHSVRCFFGYKKLSSFCSALQMQHAGALRWSTSLLNQTSL